MIKAEKVSNAAANKDRKHMSAFWSYGVKFHNFPKGNPFQEIDKLPEDSESHYVPPEEDFWKIYEVADDIDRTMLLSLIYTRRRRSEPMRWTWEKDINLRTRKIRLSTCKTNDGSRKYEWLTMSDSIYSALYTHKLRIVGVRGTYLHPKKYENYTNAASIL
jgi:hypothetical protein